MKQLLHGLALLSALCVSAQALSVQSLTVKGVRYQVVTLDPKRDKLQLFWQQNGAPLGSISALKSGLALKGQTLLFATNSGIFAPGLKPLGLHIEHGLELVPPNLATHGGNFALLPNGVFWVKNGEAGVSETRTYQNSNLKPAYASQSGPLLVQKGQLHPAFIPGSLNLATRSGVGVCAGGAVKFALSLGPVNFYDFASLFRDTLGCPDALYLDGNLSSFYTPNLGNSELTSYAGIWAVVGP